MLGVIVLHKTVLSVRKLLVEEYGRSPFSSTDTYNSAILIPVKTTILVAPPMLIPAYTWTFTGCLAQGLFFDGFPSFL